MKSGVLTAATTAIVLDSTSDLPQAATRHPNWRVVSLYVNLDGRSVRDWVDLPPEEFYRRLRASPARPTTSQPSPGDFAAVFASLEGFERVLCMTLSAKLSGTHASAVLAAQEDPRVRVVDTRTMSGGIVLLADAIQRRLAAGTTDEELGALVERYRTTSSFVWTVWSLEWLARGGRIGKARRLAGQLVETKPILGLVDGEVVPLGRVRGRARSRDTLTQRLARETADDPRLHVAIMHADAAGDAGRIAQRVAELRPSASVDFVAMFGAVLGSHTGPDSLALAWFRD